MGPSVRKTALGTDVLSYTGRIATMEAQIESMRGNLLALKNQPPKEKKKKKKEPRPAAASTSKSSTSRNAKVANAGNGAVKRKAKKQVPEDDTLSFDQKKDLSEAITKLDGQRLEKVIQIIHEGVPEIRDVGDFALRRIRRA